MAVTPTTVLAGANTFIVDVVVSAAETTSGDLAHGLGTTPLDIEIVQETAVAAGVPIWAATTIDATNIVVTRDAGGAAASTFRLIAKKPHTIAI